MSTSALPEAPDLAPLKAGDKAAQHTFWEQHWERTYAICARVLGHGADASDIATDVLHDFLFKYVQNVKEARAVRSYIRLMATRRALRRRAGMDRHRELVQETTPDQTERTAERSAGTALLAPKLARCLEELTPKARQTLKLRFGSELTNERIGELVGGSKQYIGRLIRQSTEKLKTCLERRPTPSRG